MGCLHLSLGAAFKVVPVIFTMVKVSSSQRSTYGNTSGLPLEEHHVILHIQSPGMDHKYFQFMGICDGVLLFKLIERDDVG